MSIKTKRWIGIALILFLVACGTPHAIAQFVSWTAPNGPPSFPPPNITSPLGEYLVSLPTLTNGQMYPLQVDQNGKLITSGSGGGATNATIVGPLGSQPNATSVAIAFPSDQVLGITGSVSATGTLTLGAGSAVIGHVIADTGSTTAVTGSVATTNAGTFATQAQPTPVTSGGLSTCYLQATASTNATNCKASAGQVYHIRVVGNGTAIGYLRLYNLSSAPTCTSATGLQDAVPVPQPAGGGGGGFVEDIAVGEAFSTGIGFCFSGLMGSTDNTNVAATTWQITILYK